MIIIIGLLLLFAGGAAVYGWMLMLLIGVLHAEMFPGLHPIGFWPSLAIGLLLSALTGIFRASTS